MRTAEAVRIMEKRGVVRLEAEDARLGSLKRYARWAAEHDGELVLEFSGDVPPERIVKFFEWANDEFSVRAIVRHAELKEYVTSTVAGAGAGAAGLCLLAYFAGVPITWPILLGGAAAGAIVGVLTTPLHIKVYKVKGRTRLRLAPSAP
ncbi:MAG: hypothetical protein IPN17_24500 [Deltaproteobacteria bacterium]|nr:hypothetical protein [Deltaproteobacteria bacterium]